MSDALIVPCLWFDDQGEEAAKFYTSTFPRGRIRDVARYPEEHQNPGGRPPGSVMIVDFEIAGQRFTALNGGPMFVPNPSISFFHFVQDADEARRICAALAEGGTELMAFGSYPWSEAYGWVQDRFGISWQVMLDPDGSPAPSIAPMLMFSDERQGRAEEAMEHYVGIFPDGRIGDVARFTADEGAEGQIKHGRFQLAGQTLVVMDSPVSHEFGFNEGISLQVMCSGQAEVDRYWAGLTDGGEEGPCGWLKDRFGVSWQVVPIEVTRWMGDADAAAGKRAFDAVMSMKKIDVAAVEAAHAGR